MAKKTHSGGRELKNISVKTFVSEWALRIDLDADYQREKIWSNEQQKDLLDSMLRDIDIPKMYIVEVPDNAQFDYECIDGKQRMSTLLRFFKPEPDESSPLKVRHLEKEYTYREFKKKHPTVARIIEDYELSFTIYKTIDDELVRLIFRRLQLGIRLNSGELLKTRTGTIRNFIYREIGNQGPFFRRTNLSERRFSRPYTLAQICINSFSRANPEGDFVRARLRDIEDFFDLYHDIPMTDDNLDRIRKVLKLMDKAFGARAAQISSRAVAVSAYLYAEELVKRDQPELMKKFAQFFVKLLDGIKQDMACIAKYERPSNRVVMDEFQKYVTQASVEGYSVRRRHGFIDRAFKYYLAPKTKGKLLGAK